MKWFFWAGLLLKISSGIALGLLYVYYYKMPHADTFLYFEDAATLSRLLRQFPDVYVKVVFFNDFLDLGTSWNFWFKTQPRAMLLSKLLSPVVLLTFGNYWLTGICISLFSFYGMWKLANAVADRFPEMAGWTAFSFMIFPGVVFWSAGVMKESVVLGCLCLSLSFLVQQKKKTGWQWVCILTSALVIAGLKYYYMAVMAPVLLAYLAALHLPFTQKPMLKTAFFFGMLLLFMLVASLLHPNLHPVQFMQALVKNHDIMLGQAPDALCIHYHHLQPTAASLAENLLLALVSGLFRPFVWESRTFFQFWTGLENLFLLSLTAIALYRLFSGKIKVTNWLPVVAVLTYIMLLAALLALSSPNLGTLVRYKVAFMPFWLLLLNPKIKHV